MTDIDYAATAKANLKKGLESNLLAVAEARIKAKLDRDRVIKEWTDKANRAYEASMSTYESKEKSILEEMAAIDKA